MAHRACGRMASAAAKPTGTFDINKCGVPALIVYPTQKFKASRVFDLSPKLPGTSGIGLGASWGNLGGGSWGSPGGPVGPPLVHNFGRQPDHWLSLVSDRLRLSSGPGPERAHLIRMQEGSGGPLGLPVVQDFVIQKFHRYSNYVVPPGLEVRGLRGSGGTDRPPRGGRGVFHLSLFCP